MWKRSLIAAAYINSMERSASSRMTCATGGGATDHRHLDVRSAPRVRTAIELQVPATVANAKPARASWWSRVFARTAPDA
jgi:hypothetical protein